MIEFSTPQAARSFEISLSTEVVMHGSVRYHPVPRSARMGDERWNKWEIPHSGVTGSNTRDDGNFKIHSVEQDQLFSP